MGETIPEQVADATADVAAASPLVSIIIPVHNKAAYLDECLASVAAQTYTNLEVLLVDDGSEDRSPAICDNWAAKDARFTVLHRSNGGAAVARNAGLDAASGDFVMFADADDVQHPAMVATMVEARRRTGADLVLCDYCGDNLDEKAATDLPAATRLADEVITGAEALWRTFGEHSICYIVVWNKLYARNVLEGNRFPEGALVEDEFFASKVLAAAAHVCCVPYALYGYLQREGSLSDNASLASHLAFHGAMIDRSGYLDRVGLTDRAADQFFFWSCGMARLVAQSDGSAADEYAVSRARRTFRLNYGLRKGCTFMQRARLTLIRINPRLYGNLKRLRSR